MFTIKFYTDDGFRTRIYSADSFTVLRGDNGSAEITMHSKSGENDRIDINVPNEPSVEGFPPVYQKAIIENAAGKTTEIITPCSRAGIRSASGGPWAPTPK